MSMKPRFMVLWGDGINCENETAKAVEWAHGEAKPVHISALVETPKILQEVDALVVPGGFSFGDHLGSGQVLSLKLQRFAGEELKKFVQNKPVMGICNGFQTLVKLGLLPDANFKRTCALVANQQGHFIDKWVELERNSKSPCIWTKSLPDRFTLPARHGEGRFICQSSETLKRLESKNQIVLKYTEDFNGSTERIAGVCDPSGLVFALMPHPEAAVADWQLPSKGEAWGLEFFNSAVETLKG